MYLFKSNPFPFFLFALDYVGLKDSKTINLPIKQSKTRIPTSQNSTQKRRDRRCTSSPLHWDLASRFLAAFPLSSSSPFKFMRKQQLIHVNNDLVIHSKRYSYLNNSKSQNNNNQLHARQQARYTCTYLKTKLALLLYNDTTEEGKSCSFKSSLFNTCNGSFYHNLVAK